MRYNLIQNSPRVLIVDNEERTVNLFRKILKAWDYTAVVAAGPGQSLIEDAVRKAEEFRCQIALVDMRLIDNFDEEDTSGLELIAKLKPAETIIVTAFGNVPLALNIVQNLGAAEFFEKSDSPSNLKIKLEKVAQKNCSVCKPIQIGPSELLSMAAKTLFATGVSINYHDQIRDALARLFPNAKTLRLEKMGPSIVSSDFSTVPRPRSVILRVYEDDLQPMIVKLARRSKIQREVQRFNQYIRGRLVGQYKPTLEGYVELWDIGAIKLSVVGSIEETFVNLVSTRPIEEIEESLEHFFKHTWRDHYQHSQDVSDQSLFRLYCDVWGREWVQRAREFVMPDPSEAMETEVWKQANSDHPLTWFKTIAENEGTPNDPSWVGHTRIAVTHGDLHGDNLLIDDSQHGWVMDFERTGVGHALQDFIELESDVITRIACAREEFPGFYRFCLAITGGDSIDDIQKEDPALANDETQKLLETVAVIRHLAVQCTTITDMRQYLLGLYFNIIFRATIISRDQHRKSELRAWMLATILCHRLAHWSESWPPEEWENMSSQAEES